MVRVLVVMVVMRESNEIVIVISLCNNHKNEINIVSLNKLVLMVM
jgi:hypothetical protein